MLFSECPACDQPFAVPLADAHLGRFERVECNACGAACYVQHARLDGATYSEAGFFARFPRATLRTPAH